MQPEGSPVKIVGTVSSSVYLASHQMNAFNKEAGEMPVNGRVVDLSGKIISNPKSALDVTFSQPYGKGCLKVTQVPVSKGFFKAGLWKMSDERNFKTLVKLNAGPELLKIEQHLDFVSYIETTELFLQI